MIAAEYEPEEVVSLLIERGADVNFETENGEPVLVFAFGNDDHIGSFRTVVENGSNLEEVLFDDGMTILEAAILWGETEQVDILLKNGVSVDGDFSRSRRYRLGSFIGAFGDGENAKINYDYNFEDIEKHLIGSPPIMLAVLDRKPDNIELLISAGADVNAQDYTFGKTAVMWAIEKYNYRGSSSTKVIESLITHGADLFIETDSLDTGWSYLCEYLDDTELKRILEMIPDINVKGEDGRSVLMDVFPVVEPDVFELFIQAGADVNAQNDSGMSVLLQVVEAEWDTSEMIKMLVDYGANTEATPMGEGDTILMLTAQNDAPTENIQALIDAGALVNTLDDYQRTPLFFALTDLNIDAVEILLKNGADVTLRDFLNHTALLHFIPFYNGLISLLDEAFFEEEKTLKLVNMLAARDKPQNLNEYISSLAFWELINTRKRMKLDNVAFIKPFIDAGADINCIDPVDGTTPFMTACRMCKDSKLIEWLLEHGANKELQDILERTPLVHAIHGKNYKKIIKLLE
jgi:ankyrin repeat protein